MTASIYATTVTISASTSTANAAYPVGSQRAVWVLNAGTAPIFVNSGNSSVTATSSNVTVPAGQVRLFERMATDTHLAALASTGTATVYFNLQGA